MQRHFFFFLILHHLSPVILVNTTVVAFVLLCNSSFTFHCYTLREPMPTQKWAWKRQLLSFAMPYVKDYEEHSLVQTSFAELPNINIVYYIGCILMQLSKCEKTLEWAAQALGPPGLWVRCKVTAGEKWDPHKKKPHQNSDDRKSVPNPGSELALVCYIWSAYVCFFGLFFCFSAFSFSFFPSKYPRT